MRSKKELSSPEFQTDMKPLCELLDKKRIKYELRRHPVVVADPKVKELIGYYPSGDWQVLVGQYSIIRGMVSCGSYEIMKIKGDCTEGQKFSSQERFSDPKELVKELEELK